MDSLFQEKELPRSASKEEKKPLSLRCVQVLVPLPIDKAYDYAVPEGWEVKAGDYVCVPLSGREVCGIVWDETPSANVKPSKIKEIIEIYNMPPLPQDQLEFIRRTADYYAAPLGSVLKMTISVPAGLQPAKPAKGYRISDSLDDVEGLKLTPARRAVIDLMADGQIRRAAEIAQLAGCSAGVVKGLVQKNYLEEIEIHNPVPCKNPDFLKPGAELSEDQRAVADALAAELDTNKFKAGLLDGVTGAGKTEVYFEAIAKALKQDKQVLLLLPEIALSNAFLKRFHDRFGCYPALWHSGLGASQRRLTWRGVAQGQSKVVVGARSALYLPYQNLGVIIVDEEHDSAYKQEEGVRYHARDMAILRAHLGAFPVVLVSATPSVETIHNIWQGRYEHWVLPARYGGANMPDIELADLREDKPESGSFIAPSVHEKLRETLEQGQQALLFLNRRGYAPLTLCRGCGHRMECPRCTAWLVEHQHSGLQCHHCGFQCRKPNTCPECAAEDTLVACGPGVERIAEEARLAYPDSRILILASDTAENQDHLRLMLEQIRRSEVDIIIGTQIVAKGHHFPNLTYVAVIDSDLGLQGGELRASERVYQLLHQVAGRAGREEKQGTVTLQTYMPDHAIMQALNVGGRDQFLEAELAQRESAGMPPFSRLVGVIVSSREESLALGAAKALGRCAPQSPQVQTLGPAPAPMARLRGRYRFRLLVRAEKQIHIQKTVREWLSSVKMPSTVKIAIDVDPQTFL